MRSIYITNEYNKKISFKQKEELANKMRHSILTANKNYFKLIEDDKPSDRDEEIQQLKKEIELLKIENNKLKIENNKLNELDTNTSEYKKRRRDVISYANKNNKSIKQNTIDKYDIKYDEQLKKYY